MKNLLTFVIVTLLVITAINAQGQSFTVIFLDDFSGTEIDLSKWDIWDGRTCNKVGFVSQSEELIITQPDDYNNCGGLGLISREDFSAYQDNISFEVDVRATSLHNWQDHPIAYSSPFGGFNYKNVNNGWRVGWDDENGIRQTYYFAYDGMDEQTYRLKSAVENGTLKFYRALEGQDYVLVHSVAPGHFKMRDFGCIILGSSDRGETFYDNMRVCLLEGGGEEVFCDEFDGPSIDNSIWTISTGSWSQNNGQLTGSWSVSNANNNNGIILLADSYQPAGDYEFEVDFVAGLAGEIYRPRIVLHNSYRRNIFIQVVGEQYLVSVQLFDGDYKEGLFSVENPGYLNNTPGAINTLKLVKQGENYTAFLNNHEFYTFQDEFFNDELSLGLGTYGTAVYENMCLDYGDQEEPFISHGTTVITHGFILAPDGFDSDDLEDNAKWVIPMGKAIVNRLRKGIVYSLRDGYWTEEYKLPVDSYEEAKTGEIVLLMDWVRESDKGKKGYSEAAGDALTGILLRGKELGKWNLNQLHFIGHSRGAVVNSEVIQRLKDILPNDPKIQMTTLDPHPWDDVMGDCISDPFPFKAHDYGVNSFNSAVVTWENTAFVDNYYQGLCDDDEWDWIPGEDPFLEGLGYRDEAEDISIFFPGAQRSAMFDLTTQLAPTRGGGAAFSHGEVHIWYHGTINHKAKHDSSSNDGKDSIYVDHWYPANNERYTSGFNQNINLKSDDDLKSIASQNTKQVSEDKTYWIGKVFNGDFNYHALINEPGWTFHGGGGTGKIKGKHLELYEDHEDRIHNWLNIPSNATHLYFNYRISNADYGIFPDETPCDSLSVFINNSKIGSIALRTKDKRKHWNDQKFSLANIYDESGIIRFEIVDYNNNGIESGVWVDNVDFYLNGKPSKENIILFVASPVDIVITSPDGRLLTKDSSQIKYATYDRYELYPGDTGATIIIPEPIEGLYNIDVIPQISATPIDSFTVYSFIGGETVVIVDNKTISNIPPDGYAYSTLDTGSIAGTVESNTTGLLSVPVDLYDSLGVIIASAITDDSGYYQFAGLDNGKFVVEAKTPLSFTPSSSPIVSIDVRGLSHEVNFEFEESFVNSDCSNFWWWKRQFFYKDLGGCYEQILEFTEEDIINYTQLIFDHFYNRQDDHAIQVDSVTHIGDPVRPITFEEMSEMFLAPETNDCDHQVKRSIRTILLNLASGKMNQLKEVSPDGATASQALYYLISLYQTGEQQSINKANLYLMWLQYGIAIPPGIIPLSTPNIMYKAFEESASNNSDSKIPDKFQLSQNRPNPFNPVTEISFSLPQACQVVLDVYNVTGQKVAVIASGHFDAGNHSITWDASNQASGVYFYRLQAGEFDATRKMLLLK